MRVIARKRSSSLRKELSLLPRRHLLRKRSRIPTLIRKRRHLRQNLFLPCRNKKGHLMRRRRRSLQSRKDIIRQERRRRRGIGRGSKRSEKRES